METSWIVSLQSRWFEKLQILKNIKKTPQSDRTNFANLKLFRKVKDYISYEFRDSYECQVCSSADMKLHNFAEIVKSGKRKELYLELAKQKRIILIEKDVVGKKC